MNKTIKSVVDIFLGVLLGVLIMYYIVSNIDKYYMITFFSMPIGIHILRIYYETKKNTQLQKIEYIKYLFFCVLTIQILLSYFFPDVNIFFMRADRVVFPFFYLKPVEFSYWWIMICWLLLGLMKNRLLRLMLGITIFFGWLLVYNLL